MFIIGVGAAWLGGMSYFLAGLSGIIPTTRMPGTSIDRHDDPDRFLFWHRMMGVVFVSGVAILAARLIVG